MSLNENIALLLERYNELDRLISSPDIYTDSNFGKYSKEHSKLQESAILINKYLSLQNLIKDLESELKITNDNDMRIALKEELLDSQKKIEIVRLSVEKSFIPKDRDDSRNVILEIRAGTGGDEAALFSSELFQMYRMYAEKNKWDFDVISISPNGVGGYKEASVNIKGKDVYAKLKFESGVHRVQRVPETESSGRLHTSAVTVAVLPEAEEVDVQFADKDIRIDVYRASGPGGQSVNTTDSAVRVTHIPTGLVVIQQDEKSQIKNKTKALKVLRTRIYEKKKQEENDKISALRKQQVGTGDRSERIRTYNFPQSRITDHRINYTSHRIVEILKEGRIDDFIDKLTADYETKMLNTQ
ncbi:MAG: peptide chain release factor 1 [Anaplasmataceae bacterium]|nr:peptide chain release factor 1 [Anaplasmataceae bacterium]